MTSLKAFEALVADALDELPAYIQQRLENVAVVVEERARGERLEGRRDDENEGLLGLYREEGR